MAYKYRGGLKELLGTYNPAHAAIIRAACKYLDIHDMDGFNAWFGGGVCPNPARFRNAPQISPAILREFAIHAQSNGIAGPFVAKCTSAMAYRRTAVVSRLAA